MSHIVGNPASRWIKRGARRAYEQAGVSVQGQLAVWMAIPPDPGKDVFWRDELEVCGVPPRTAYRIVTDLHRAWRSW